MRWKWLWVPLFVCALCCNSAKGDNRIIVRTTLGLQGLQTFCNGLPLLQNCTVVGGLDGSLGQLFLITTPVNVTTLLNLLGNTVGIVDAEADQLLSLVGDLNQSTAAVLDQSTAAVLDTSQYAAFGHGTMVMGIIHLVAPAPQLLPLKAFSSNGTGYLSDILHATYYGVQNGANVINMSFDMTSNSLEFNKAVDYAEQSGVICAASAGNDGMQEIVYPAAYQNDVMGVASTSNSDTPSSFSNFGNVIVWVAAPGEGIISTYPFSTYAAGWGTSFSAPFVSGAGALLLNLDPTMNEFKAAAAVAHAVP